ncbi:MAG TPA: hypothetical protein VIR16_08070, partial [Candidatus Limnocylindrales bacterium]
FMHMLRDEDNAGYRRVLKETLEFDPEILKRYVNFMNNPDEKTAVEQFGKGDKYFGIATLLATLPGLPMLGHGQFEGFAEKYGMEFRRAAWNEPVDEGLVARHEREIVPLLHRRGDFAEAQDFLLYDVEHDLGGVEENVFAFSNGTGASRSLVVYHNRFGDTAGWIRQSTPYAVKDADGTKRLAQRTLAEGLGLAEGDANGRWLAIREQRSGLEYLRSLEEIRDRGLHVELRAYETRVFWQMRVLHDTSGVWRRLADRLEGRGVASLDTALRDLQLAPVHDAVRVAIESPTRDSVARVVDAVEEATGTAGDREAVIERIVGLWPAADTVAAGIKDASQAAALRVWTLLAPLGSLPRGAMVGPTARAWFEELRLAPVVADGLRRRGLDEGAAWWAAERVRLLVDLPVPSMVRGAADAVPLRLVDRWLSHPVARPFLRVNDWEGVAWFHGESLDELLAWGARLEALAGPRADRAGDAVADHGAVEPRPDPDDVLAQIRRASTLSDFRVDRLRDQLFVPGAELPEPVLPSEPEAERSAAVAPLDAVDSGPLPEVHSKVDVGRRARLAGEAAAEPEAAHTVAEPEAEVGPGAEPEPEARPAEEAIPQPEARPAEQAIPDSAPEPAKSGKLRGHKGHKGGKPKPKHKRG